MHTQWVLKEMTHTWPHCHIPLNLGIGSEGSFLSLVYIFFVFFTFRLWFIREQHLLWREWTCLCNEAPVGVTVWCSHSVRQPHTPKLTLFLPCAMMVADLLILKISVGFSQVMRWTKRFHCIDKQKTRI